MFYSLYLRICFGSMFLDGYPLGSMMTGFGPEKTQLSGVAQLRCEAWIWGIVKGLS